MAQENTVSFKVFLQVEGSSDRPEVRRFGVDRDVVSSYSYLIEKLRLVFPSLRSKEFDVTWKDSEGDDVKISSDDELIIALAEMQVDVRKLYVTVNKSAEQKEPASTGPQNGNTVHPGVTCDGCEKDVQGFRYKCIQCSDYDLCCECEAKGTHSQHHMIRIPVPMSWRPYFGRRLARHLSKSTRKGGHCPAGESGEGECRPPHWRPHHHGRGGGMQSWLEMLSQYLNEWSNLPGEGEQDAAAAQEATEKPTGKEGAKKTPEQKQDEATNEKYLRTVGETVANILNPLGIDVQIDVEHNGRTATYNDKKRSPKQEDVKKGTTSPKEKKSDVGEQKEKVESKPQETKKVEFKRDTRESPESEGWTVVNQEETAQSAVVSPPAENLLTPQEANGTETKQGPASDAQVDSTPAPTENNIGRPPQQPLFAPPPPPGFVPNPMHQSFDPFSPQFMMMGQTPQQLRRPMVYPHLGYYGQQVPNRPQVVPHPNMQPMQAPLQPQQQQQPHPAPHPNPRIQSALDAMLSMGFVNDGGWLTQLLEVKDGDIAKVLDVLQPVQKST